MEHHLFVIYLSHSHPRYVFSLHFPLSTPLSCCFWLLVGVLQRQINRRDCLFLPVGNNSALLTLYYLALGYLNPLIYYKEHSVMISSTLGMSRWHSGSVRGEEPPPDFRSKCTNKYMCGNTDTYTRHWYGLFYYILLMDLMHKVRIHTSMHSSRYVSLRAPRKRHKHTRTFTDY